MTDILNSMHKFENRFNERAQRFAFRHPYIAFLIMFIGMPLLILSAVTVGTALFVLPLALIFG